MHLGSVLFIRLTSLIEIKLFTDLYRCRNSLSHHWKQEAVSFVLEHLTTITWLFFWHMVGRYESNTIHIIPGLALDSLFKHNTERRSSPIHWSLGFQWSQAVVHTKKHCCDWSNKTAWFCRVFIDNCMLMSNDKNYSANICIIIIFPQKINLWFINDEPKHEIILLQWNYVDVVTSKLDSWLLMKSKQHDPSVKL